MAAATPDPTTPGAESDPSGDESDSGKATEFPINTVVPGSGTADTDMDTDTDTDTDTARTVQPVRVPARTNTTEIDAATRREAAAKLRQLTTVTEAARRRHAVEDADGKPAEAGATESTSEPTEQDPA